MSVSGVGTAGLTPIPDLQGERWKRSPGRRGDLEEAESSFGAGVTFGGAAARLWSPPRSGSLQSGQMFLLDWRSLKPEGREPRHVIPRGLSADTQWAGKVDTDLGGLSEDPRTPGWEDCR